MMPTTFQRHFPLLAVMILISTVSLQAGEKFPAVYASTEDSVARVAADGTLDWAYPLPEPADYLEIQPSGNLLVSGGPNHVFLLSRVGQGFKVVWDWAQLGDLHVWSAVAAERDLKGNPNLILAAESGGNRIILGEARSTRPKIRWEYKVDLPIRQAILCPDTGNFLVLSWSDPVTWAIEEIDFRSEKVVWSLRPGDGPGFPVAVARDEQGRTFVADLLENNCRAYDGNKRLLWKTPKGCRRGLKRMTARVKSYGERVLYLTNDSEPQVLDAASGESVGCRKDFYPSGAKLYEPNRRDWREVEPEYGLLRRPREVQGDR